MNKHTWVKSLLDAALLDWCDDLAERLEDIAWAVRGDA